MQVELCHQAQPQASMVVDRKLKECQKIFRMLNYFERVTLNTYHIVPPINLPLKWHNFPAMVRGKGILGESFQCFPSALHLGRLSKSEGHYYIDVS